ncbi:MAG: hypothetical protein ACTSRZ_12130 [Promethearchaeota archaeon]
MSSQKFLTKFFYDVLQVESIDLKKIDFGIYKAEIKDQKDSIAPNFILDFTSALIFSNESKNNYLQRINLETFSEDIVKQGFNRFFCILDVLKKRILFISSKFIINIFSCGKDLSKQEIADLEHMNLVMKNIRKKINSSDYKCQILFRLFDAINYIWNVIDKRMLPISLADEIIAFWQLKNDEVWVGSNFKEGFCFSKLKDEINKILKANKNKSLATNTTGKKGNLSKITNLIKNIDLNTSDLKFSENFVEKDQNKFWIQIKGNLYPSFQRHFKSNVFTSVYNDMLNILEKFLIFREKTAVKLQIEKGVYGFLHLNYKTSISSANTKKAIAINVNNYIYDLNHNYFALTKDLIKNLYSDEDVNLFLISLNSNIVMKITKNFFYVYQNLREEDLKYVYEGTSEIEELSRSIGLPFIGIYLLYFSSIDLVVEWTKYYDFQESILNEIIGSWCLEKNSWKKVYP